MLEDIETYAHLPIYRRGETGLGFRLLAEKENAGRRGPAWRGGGSPRRLNWGGKTYGLIAICPYDGGVSGSTCASHVVADAPSAKRLLTLCQVSHSAREAARRASGFRVKIAGWSPV
jgi:hypothetical protein